MFGALTERDQQFLTTSERAGTLTDTMLNDFRHQVHDLLTLQKASLKEREDQNS